MSRESILDSRRITKVTGTFRQYHMIYRLSLTLNRKPPLLLNALLFSVCSRGKIFLHPCPTVQKHQTGSCVLSSALVPNHYFQVPSFTSFSLARYMISNSTCKLLDLIIPSTPNPSCQLVLYGPILNFAWQSQLDYHWLLLKLLTIFSFSVCFVGLCCWVLGFFFSLLSLSYKIKKKNFLS